MGRLRTQTTGTVVLVGASLLAAACAPAPAPAVPHPTASSTPAAPHPTAPSTLAAQYLRTAETANRRLEIDLDRLAGPDRDHLANALADLRDAASTELMFDRDLLRLPLPPAVKVTAQDLVKANESRSRLTSTLSAYRSLAQLHLDEKNLTAANGAVEDSVRTLRRQLGLPPPDTS